MSGVIDFCISSDVLFLTIPCVTHDYILEIDVRRRSGIHLRRWFRTWVVTQFSVTISRSTMTQVSLMIYGSAVTYHFWQFHASIITLFLLPIRCVGLEFINAIDSIRQQSLRFQWWFLGLEALNFRSWFMVSSDAVFTGDYMRQTWLCFLCWFHASTVNLFSLSIPCVIHDSIFATD
jgi:hypothetical protein